MTKRKSRCMLLVMLTFILAVGALNGCGGKDPEENENGAGGSGAPKGRYMEEEIKLPLQEGERAINLSKSTEGNPVLFASSDDAKIRRCEYIDGEWEEKNLEWVEDTCKGKMDYPISVTETKEGIQLVIGMGEEMKTCIARSKDGQSGVG